MPRAKEGPGAIVGTQEIEELAVAQNKLATSLISWARTNQLTAKDWVQGGWSRGKDRIDTGWRVAGALEERI